MYPDPQYLAVPEVAEEHRASKANAGELEEFLHDVRHWDLHGKRKGRIVRILQVEQQATQGIRAPL